MKTKLLLTFLLFYNLLNAQIVNIPDQNFKQALLLGIGDTPPYIIDTNEDGEIQVSEAQAFTENLIVDSNYLDFYNIGQITDLTGIEAFINITGLDCSGNLLTNLDISQNTELTGLDCFDNQITNLNVTQNLNLEELICSGNQLTDLNTSQNIFLDFLICGDNQITSLDFTNNILLEYIYGGSNQLTNLDVSQNFLLITLNCGNSKLTNLDVSSNLNLRNLNCYNNLLTDLDVSQNFDLRDLLCYNNLLTDLDLSQNNLLHRLFCQNNLLLSLNVQNGNNTNFSDFKSGQNLDLTCIFVDDKVYSEVNWTDIDPNSHFVETQLDCDTISVDDEILNNIISIYPNPNNGIFIIENKYQISNIKYQISNVLGKTIVKNKIIYNTTQIDLSNQPSGIYFLTIKSNNQILTKKIIKL